MCVVVIIKDFTSSAEEVGKGMLDEDFTAPTASTIATTSLNLIIWFPPR
jgi:hypothetical protein